VDHNFYKTWYQHSKQVWWINMHIFVAHFLGYAATKNYWNWTIFSQVFAKVKSLTFFWNTVYVRVRIFCYDDHQTHKKQERLLSVEDEPRMSLLNIRPRIKLLFRNHQAQVSQWNVRYCQMMLRVNKVTWETSNLGYLAVATRVYFWFGLQLHLLQCYTHTPVSIGVFFIQITKNRKMLFLSVWNKTNPCVTTWVPRAI